MFDKVIATLKEYPLFAVGGVIFLLFIMRIGGSKQPRNAYDPSVTLESMRIASDANVKLSAIGVDYQKVAASQNLAAMDVMRDISLGAQELAKADKVGRTQQNLATIASMDNAMQVNAGLTSNLLNVLSGTYIADKEYKFRSESIQSDAMLNLAALNFSGQAAKLDYDRQVNKDNLTHNQQVNKDNLDYNLSRYSLDTTFAKAQLDQTSYLATLPVEMHIAGEREATIRNLAWRQKQIAQGNVFGGLMGSLMGTVGQVASTAMKFI